MQRGDFTAIGTWTLSNIGLFELSLLSNGQELALRVQVGKFDMLRDTYRLLHLKCLDVVGIGACDISETIYIEELHQRLNLHVDVVILVRNVGLSVQYEHLVDDLEK